MNLFYLDSDPITCAEYHCDKHVIKMVLESAQMLSTCQRAYDNDTTYRPTHVNHPVNVWLRQSVDHYDYLFNLYCALLGEYDNRYSRTHKSARVMFELNKYNFLPKASWTDPPQCMPDYCKRIDTIDAYRVYYVSEKAYMAKWQYSQQPEWWPI